MESLPSLISEFASKLTIALASELSLEPSFKDGTLEPSKRYGIISFAGIKFPDLRNGAFLPCSYVRIALEFDLLVSACVNNSEAARPSLALLNSTMMSLSFEVVNAVVSATSGIEISSESLLLSTPYTDSNLSAGGLRQQVREPRHWEFDTVLRFTVPGFCYVTNAGVFSPAEVLRILPTN